MLHLQKQRGTSLCKRTFSRQTNPIIPPIKPSFPLLERVVDQEREREEMAAITRLANLRLMIKEKTMQKDFLEERGPGRAVMCLHQKQTIFLAASFSTGLERRVLRKKEKEDLATDGRSFATLSLSLSFS